MKTVYVYVRLCVIYSYCYDYCLLLCRSILIGIWQRERSVELSFGYLYHCFTNIHPHLYDVRNMFGWNFFWFFFHLIMLQQWASLYMISQCFSRVFHPKLKSERRSMKFNELPNGFEMKLLELNSVAIFVLHEYTIPNERETKKKQMLSSPTEKRCDGN